MEFWEVEGYEFVRRLSRENSTRFGETVLLQHKISGKEVVLKSVDLSKNVGFEQLQNEAKFDFNFQGLPKLISSHLSSEKFFLLKEYAEGKTLMEYWLKVKRKNRLTELKRIIAALQPVFSELEKREIIHCDIKPENILVDERNGEIYCSLIDFGLAFHKHEFAIRKTLFQLAYAPPEIILNQLDCADFHSDVFSFCIVVYRLWTGKLPFSQTNPALLTQLQITYPIEKPWRMPKTVWLILEKGLRKHQFTTSPNRMTNQEVKNVLLPNNARRYKSFTELANAFD